MFSERDGEIVLINSSLFSIREAQVALADVDVSEADILGDVMGLRYGKDGQK